MNPFLTLYTRKFAAFYTGCLSCYLLQNIPGVTNVLASALIGFLGTLLPLPEKYNRQGLQIALYTGSFVGMGSRELLGSHLHLFLVSLFGALVYILAKPLLQGVGGKLGAIAFVSSLFLLLLKAAL